MTAYRRWHVQPVRWLPRQLLLVIRGFLNYVVRTYPWMNPYTKGLHLTIDGWRGDRTWDGWRLHCKKASEGCTKAAMSTRRVKNDTLDASATAAIPSEPALKDPEWVLPMPRLWGDARALVELTNTDEPPRPHYRGSSNNVAFYMPGDASGSGFGSALISAHNVLYEAGTWSGDWRAESSNFREADNLVTRVEALAAEGAIVGQELFLFTDNLVFEMGYYKDHLASKKLSDILFRLHKAERNGGFKLHVIHVAGTPMKS